MTNKGKRLRSGITTGASAAAAAGAAARLLGLGQSTGVYKVTNPAGKELAVKVKDTRLEDGLAIGIVTKDGGDDPDRTHGLDIVAKVRFFPGEEVLIKAGQGVGTVTKLGLQLGIGEPAINPVPRQMIIEAVTRELPAGYGAEIVISVPGGEEVAQKTLNPKLGIVGGISILGTTGIVEPMSEDAFKRSLVPQISMAKSYGYTTICLTPGRLGEKWAGQVMGLQQECIVQMSNFVGYMLEACVREGITGVILLGHHSKISKVAAGCFHTHNRVADARRETLTAYSALAGAEPAVLKRLMKVNTAEEGYEILKSYNMVQVYEDIAEAVSRRAMELVFEELKVGTVMFTMQGEIIACDKNARELGEKLGWHY